MPLRDGQAQVPLGSEKNRSADRHPDPAPIPQQAADAGEERVPAAEELRRHDAVHPGLHEVHILRQR